MSVFKPDGKIQILIAAVIAVVGLVLAVTRYKLPARNINLSLLTNNANMTANVNSSYPFSSVPDADLQNKQVRIKTNRGDIVFKLEPEAGPLAAKNFYYLAKRGFYDNLTWHRVVDNFVIQGGDPTGTGSGGPGYQFPDDPVDQNYIDGTVAMANSGTDTNGSQFFICKGTACQGLERKYSIFGEVTSGMDVVKSIVQGDKIISVTIEPIS